MNENIKGLFIKEPWISLILEGKKVWEIRGSNSKIRGRIALIASGTGEVKGYIDIVDSIELDRTKFECNSSKHLVDLNKYSNGQMPYKKTFAWVFANPKKLSKGIKFNPKKGCVIWINLNEKNIIQNSN